jgi:hypothetical protein
MSTFTKLTTGRIIFEDNDGNLSSFAPFMSIIPHPSDASLALISPYASGQQVTDESLVFEWSKVTVPAGITTRNGLVTALNNDYFSGYSPQNPLPTDGDSVYSKDIDIDRSIIGDFSGDLSDLFDDLHSENVNNTATNPKLLTIHFNRTVVTPLIGLGSSEGGTFSNTKIIGILSGDIETTIADFSDDNTLRTTYPFSFPNTGLNAVRFEFHTANTISLTNCFIPKLRVVSAVSQSSVVLPNAYKSPYMLNGTHGQDMAQNGSVTPIDYVYEVTGFGSASWIRNFIDLQDGNTNFLAENFGAIVGGLTNGVDVIVEKDGVEVPIENWKTNMDISMTCYDFTPPYRTGAYIGRWTITSDLGVPITLFPGDRLIVRINDDLTGLDAFRFRSKLKQ